jgi:hypothetical protein
MVVHPDQASLSLASMLATLKNANFPLPLCAITPTIVPFHMLTNGLVPSSASEDHHFLQSLPPDPHRLTAIAARLQNLCSPKPDDQSDGKYTKNNVYISKQGNTTAKRTDP